MTLQQLRYFCEIAKTSNYTQAAQNLFVSQPTVSHAIQNLEEELNAPLFFRGSNQKVKLSEFGEILFPVAETVLCQLENCMNQIHEAQNPYSGIVRVGYSFVSAYSIERNMINSLRKNMLDKAIAVQEHAYHESFGVLNHLVNQDVDLLFGSSLSHPAIERVQIGLSSLMVYVPCHNILSKKSSVKTDDLIGQTIYVPNVKTDLAVWLKEMFKSSNIKLSLSEAGYTTNWASFLSVLETDDAVAILPKMPISLINVAMVPLDHRMSKRPIYLGWSKEKTLSKSAEWVRDSIIKAAQK